MVGLAVTACQPAVRVDLPIADARPINYDAIRNASGVLAYSESLLGPRYATSYSASIEAGASRVDPALVAGAWELPLSTQPAQLSLALRSRGTLERVREYREGQLWIADYQAPGERPLRLLLINGAHYRFEQDAVAEVRPGQHVYLIAYRNP